MQLSWRTSKIRRLATSVRHDNYAMVTDRGKFTIKWSRDGMFGFHFYRQNQFKIIPQGCTLFTRNQPKFSANSDVRYSIKQYAAVLPGWQKCKKSRLNGRLKISNTADNADITQSKARDTRHCRMQEVNSLYTDCVRVEYCIVFIPHNTAM